MFAFETNKNNNANTTTNNNDNNNNNNNNNNTSNNYNSNKATTTITGEEEPPNSTTQQTVAVNSSPIGRVEEFVPGTDWEHYVKRVEMFEVNNVLEFEAKKVPTILTLMGNKMYALLRSIVSPRRSKKLSFAEIVDNLAKHVLVVADLSLQTAVERACAAELTEKGNHCIAWRKCG